MTKFEKELFELVKELDRLMSKCADIHFEYEIPIEEYMDNVINFRYGLKHLLKKYPIFMEQGYQFLTPENAPPGAAPPRSVPSIIEQDNGDHSIFSLTHELYKAITEDAQWLEIKLNQLHETLVSECPETIVYMHLLNLVKQIAERYRISEEEALLVIKWKIK